MPSTMLRRTLPLAGLDVPVVELAGAEDGPRLTVLAGVHGCEYAPMAAVRRWARGLAERELRGSVVAVPVLNLPTFRARSPFVVPDDGGGRARPRAGPGARAARHGAWLSRGFISAASSGCAVMMRAGGSRWSSRARRAE